MDESNSGHETTKHLESKQHCDEGISTLIIGLDNVCSAPANVHIADLLSTSTSLMVEQSEETDTASAENSQQYFFQC